MPTLFEFPDEDAVFLRRCCRGRRYYLSSFVVLLLLFRSIVESAVPSEAEKEIQQDAADGGQYWRCDSIPDREGVVIPRPVVEQKRPEEHERDSGHQVHGRSMVGVRPASPEPLCHDVLRQYGGERYHYGVGAVDLVLVHHLLAVGFVLHGDFVFICCFLVFICYCISYCIVSYFYLYLSFK